MCETDKYRYGTVTCAMSKLSTSATEIVSETSDDDNSGNEGESLLINNCV